MLDSVFSSRKYVLDPMDRFHVGLVAQRTKAYQTSFDTQRGLLVGFSHKKAEFTPIS
jgi:hypothetical protein